ncbi:MAG: hypothetical protein FJ399_19105 [Verrucomicrobia bacterium]|nr:hypothetical protein [Verrucomicrobiota bacterium]
MRRFSRSAKTYGFELPPPPQVAPADIGQGELFGDEFTQPDANDGEPVFWPDAADQSPPDAAYVQPRKCS